MIKTLWQEIQQQGFTGSYSSLWKFLHTWPLPAGMVSSAASVSFVPVARATPATRTPRQTMWLLLRDPEELSETDAAYRQALFHLAPSLEDFSILSREFLQMIKKRERETFLPWLTRAKACPAEEMRRFALGLENELAAALAALTEPWSTGQVEGQITRLKLLKQQKQCVIFETIGIANTFLELLTSLKKKYSVFLIQVRVPSHVALERVSRRDQTHQIQIEKEVIAHINEQSLQMKLEYDLILENEQATDAQLIQQLNTIWTPSR